MTDWTTAPVVRDRYGALWARINPGSGQLMSLDGNQMRIGPEGLESTLGPLTPVLDADGLPVVRTVGDLTARHQLTRAMVRLDGSEGALRVVAPSDTGDGRVLVIWGNRWVTVAAGTPCEVLP